MKRILSVISASVVAIAMSGTINVSAKTAEMNEDIVLHGNKCGTVKVTSQIDRDVYIKIDCETPDAPAYHYYDCVILANDADNVLDFVLEGDNEAVYTITVGVAKYKNSVITQNVSEQIYVYDTDEMDDGTLGYNYNYTIREGSEIGSNLICENVKDENNIINYDKDLLFPLSTNPIGDTNSDSIINVRDCAFIAKALAKGIGDTLPESADFNGDGEMNVRDAAAIASALASGTLK